MIRFLSLRNIQEIHEDTIRHEGGSHGVRDEGLLASAVAMPQATFGGTYLHAGISEMSAAYLFHICQNHAFIDGNKRAAAFAAVIFLDLNGAALDDLPDESKLEEVALLVASGEMTKQDVVEFFRNLRMDANT